MHTRVLDNSKLDRLIMVRPLKNGDTATVSALLDRLGAVSREQRFHAAKPRLTLRDLDALARVDENHHVLVAYVDGDPLPAAMARIVRSFDDRRTGELAVEVADDYHGCGVGTQLVEVFLTDVRAAGIACIDDAPAAPAFATG